MITYSSIEQIYFILPVIGFIVGLFGTMLGGGGGFFFFPVLTLLIGVNPQTAVITSLVATLPICIIGSIGHFKNGLIHKKYTGIFVSAGIPGALAGVLITSRVNAQTLRLLFGLYSCALALNLIYSTWRNKSSDSVSPISGHRTQKIKGLIYGFFAGMITGTFGTSGTAPVLAGLFSMKIKLKEVIGTSLIIVLINTLFATGAHLMVSTINLTVVIFLTAGSAIGAALGPHLIKKVNTDHSESKIRYVYALVMIAIGIIMMKK